MIITQLKLSPTVKRKIYCNDSMVNEIINRTISSDIEIFATDFRSKDIIHITDDICMIDGYLFY